MIARMEIEPTQNRFDLAAEPSLARIRRDRETAPRRIQPLLAYLESHVYDLDLDYQQLKKACGVRDNTIPALFHQAAGLPPATYIRDCRMETAARLLSESDVKVWQISQLVGYSSLQVFGRAFKRWSKLSPVAYRRRHRKPADRQRRQVSLRRSSEIADTFRRALQGQASASEIAMVMEQLVELYPQSVRAVLASPSSASQEIAAVAPSHPLIASDRVQRIQAEAIWSRLADLPEVKQRELIHRDLHLRTSAFFHFLREKSREVGRDDRARGVAVAELALETLSAMEPQPPAEELAGLATLGWASLANARRLALDFSGAESALDRAEHQLQQANPDEELRAEVLTHKAALRWYERRFAEAVQLQSEAIGLLRAVAEPRRIAKGLVWRAAIRLGARKAEQAIPDLEEALKLAGDYDPISHSALPNLVYAYLESGRIADAAQALPRVSELAASAPDRLHALQLTWLEGLVRRATGDTRIADRSLTAAREGLLEVGAHEHAAGVSLDLAELRFSTGDVEAAAQLASEALPLLASLGLHTETAAAHGTLAASIAAGQVTVDVIREAKAAVETFRRDPLRSYDRA